VALCYQGQAAQRAGRALHTGVLVLAAEPPESCRRAAAVVAAATLTAPTTFAPAARADHAGAVGRQLDAQRPDAVPWPVATARAADLDNVHALVGRRALCSDSTRAACRRPRRPGPFECGALSALTLTSLPARRRPGGAIPRGAVVDVGVADAAAEPGADAGDAIGVCCTGAAAGPNSQVTQLISGCPRCRRRLLGRGRVVAST